MWKRNEYQRVLEWEFLAYVLHSFWNRCMSAVRHQLTYRDEHDLFSSDMRDIWRSSIVHFSQLKEIMPNHMSKSGWHLHAAYERLWNIVVFALMFFFFHLIFSFSLHPHSVKYFNKLRSHLLKSDRVGSQKNKVIMSLINLVMRCL